MESILVKDYMNRRPVIFGPDETIFEAIQHLLNSGLTGGPVVGPDKKLLGFLSEQDCLAKGLEASYYCERIAKVDELMRRDVLTVTPELSIIELAQQMEEQKPKVYPVIDKEGVLVGVISRRDVLRAIEHAMRACFKRMS